MNKIYKVIWSKVKHQYVVVSELAHRDGKRSSAASKSVRTLLAVLAVCGMYGIQNSYAAEGTTTLPYQYVATGQASIGDATGNNGVYVDRPWWPGGGYWEKEPTEYYKDITVGDKTYRYVYTEANDGKAYWVREGYSINIVEDERFTGADPDTVIQYHKEDPNADDSGLVQSFQNVDKNLGVTTAHGDTLWSTSTGVYAGAVNSPTTEVTSGIPTGSQGNQFVINNGTTTVGKSTFTQYFREVNYNSKTGEYMYNGNPVDMSALRVVDGQIGVFLTSPNGDEVYTGDVFGVHNEILMTGTNENGDLVSYWGAEDIDPMAPIGSMPKYLFDEKFEKIDNDLVALHKDDIKEIQVSETSGGNGGTLGLIRNGGRAVDGAVTVTSTGGTDGNDVKVQFSNDWTDKEGVRHSGSFTVDAGSKVVGKVNNNGATVDANPGDTLTSIDINGQNYKLGGGKTYTAGNNINIDDNNVISTTKTTVSVDDNFTVTPTTDEAKNITDYNIKLNNVVTVGSGEKSVTIDGENGQVTGLTNTSLDVAGFAESNRAATEEQLDLVRQNALNLDLTNITDNGKKVIKGLEQHITPGEYEVQADGTVTMTYVDGNGQTVQDQTAKITGIATDAAVKAAKTVVVKGTNIASVTESTGADGQTVYTVNAEGAKVSADDNFTVTPTTDKATNVTDYNIKLNNVVTVGSGEKSVTIDGENGQVTGLTNTSLDVAGFAESNRAATEEQLDLVRQNALNLDLTNITDNGKKVIKGLEQHITPGEYEVQADGTVTMTYVDGNGQTVQDQTAKITGIATDAAVKAAKTTVSGSNNISAVGTQQTDGHTDYNVKLNDNVYLGGNQTAGNSNIALEGSTGSIHAATTKGNHTFDFNSNGGKFETKETKGILLKTTTTHTATFDNAGATFTKKTSGVLGGEATSTNINGSKITSDGVGQTVVDGGSVTVQGVGSILGTNTTTVEGSKITSVGTLGSLLGDTTEIDGAYINAGGIKVNGELLRDNTITGLSNTEWKNDEAWQKTHIRDNRVATEGQLQDVADSLSGDVSKLDDFAVKYDEVNGKPDYSTVTLEGTNGTKITNLAKGEVTATSTDAVNGSQLFEVQELAGKHTTMTVNNGMVAPEDGSYTTDGNLQLKQKVGDKGQIEYDVKLNDNLVLGKGDSQITLNGAPTDENAPAISVGEVFTVGQDGSVHAAVAGDSTSDSMSFTNGGLTISNMSGDVSSATVIKGADIQAGGIHLDGTDKIIDGLSNTEWTGMTTTPDKAATEGQLQMVSDRVASGWTATDDKGHKINVNPNTHPTLNFASGKNITVSAENDEINVALNDNVYLGEDNAIALEGSTGHISATVKDSLGMSSNTLTFDDKGLTVSKDAMGVGSGSTNISGDTIKTTDEYDHETTIDGGSVTTEKLVVKGNSDNKMTFNADGLNVNTGDAQLNVSEDELSLNVDNGAGWNNSVKITQDDTTFSYSENGVTGATTTVIQGQKITAGDVLINGEDGKNTITGLTNTTWKNDAAWQADNIVADRAATEGQLQKAAAAATTTVSEGKNIDVTKTIDKEDGHTNYEVALQDNVSLGDGTILLNGVPKDGDALLNVDNKLVVEQDGTTTITVNDGTQMGDNTTVTVGADGVTFAGYGNGNTVINGQTIQAGGVFINDGGNGEITRLTNTTLDDPTFATVGRAATEEQLKLAAAAATTTVSEGKNIDVKETVDTEDGHTNYEVSLKDNVSLGDGKIVLNGAPKEGDDLLNVDNKLVVGQDGTTTIAVNDGTVDGGGNNTTVTVAADGVTFAGNWNGTTIINGQTIQAGGIYINDEETKGTIVGLTNTEWTGSTNEPSRAATEGQLQQAAAASKTTLSNGKNTTVTSKTAEDGHVDYQVNLNDHIVLGDQDGKNNNISINGNEASIILNGFENGEYKNSIEIDAASGMITGLTNAIGDGKDGWETFTDKDTVHGSRAVTEDDLYEVYRHGVQYSVNDDGTPDYTTIVLGNPYNANTKGGGTRITNVAYAETDRKSTEYDGSAAVNVDVLNDAVDNATATVTGNEKHIATNVGPKAEMPHADYSVGEDGKVTLTEVDGNGKPTGNSVVISDVASATDVGNVDKLVDAGLGVDENGNSNVVDAILDVDNKVGDLNYNDVKGDSIQNGDDTTTAIGKLDNRIDGLETDISGAAEEAKKHNTVEAGSNIVVTTSQNANGGTEYKVSVDPNLKVDTVTASGNIDAGSFSTGDITINKDNSGTINGLSNTTWNKEVADAIAANANGEAGTAATQGQLQQAMNGAVQYDTNKDGSVNKDSITLGGSTYDPETHKGGTTITNVADGKNASDAVNMNQLWQTNQAVINNSNNISMLSNSVNKLDTRIDRVGAGAAALAALHPLDFDPDAKWDFAAGYGNYRGANAVAVGAYYRPNEDVMFSVGGSMGGGENMVNAGVSLKIGAGSSNVTTSRVAMAKEIKSMRDIVAKQDAQIQKLTAMVNALVGIQSEPDTTTMFPDVPENHWAYEAVEAMAKSGLVKGYPDGEFKGDRTMTRYEFAQIVYNAIQAGAEVDARLVEEFKPELEYFHIATVAKDKDGNPTIERVRAN